ncbi:MAG TPA: MFS transporter [Burkholderiales bacterium]|nr:MFS transporter [Burkholderiales bacterium]
MNDDPGEPSRAQRPAWITPLAVTLSIQTLVAVAMYCAPVFAPVAVRDLGVAPSAVGWFIATAYLGSMIGSASAGGWITRVGPIRMSQAGLLACLAGLALAASATLPLVLLGAFVVGLGYGPTTPASSLILVRATPPSQVSLTFSIKQTGVPAGGAIAGLLVPALILGLGWRGGAVAIGIGCFALAVAIEPWRARYDYGLNPKAAVSLQSILAPVRLVLGERRLRQMAVTSFVYGGVQITLVTYLVTFLVDRFGLELVLAGFVMSISQVGSIAGRILWGLFADRFFRRRTMLGLLGLGMGISSIATLATGPEWPRWLLFAFASVFGATAVGWNGVFLAEVARIAPAAKVSEATGGCLFFTFLGVVVTPPAFNAVLAVTANYAAAYAAFGVPALIVGAWLLVARPPGITPERAE